MTLPILATDLLVLGETLLIDLSLAGDNALLIALIVQNMQGAQRKQAIWFGALAGGALRCCLALIAATLLQFPAISLIGGLLLAWVCYGLARNLISPQEDEGVPAAQTKFEAILKIIIADLSMSLDNVLAIAGATASHPVLMSIGIGFSVLAVIFLARKIAYLLTRYKWIGWCGLAIIVFVTMQLLIKGVREVSVYL